MPIASLRVRENDKVEDTVDYTVGCSVDRTGSEALVAQSLENAFFIKKTIQFVLTQTLHHSSSTYAPPFTAIALSFFLPRLGRPNEFGCFEKEHPTAAVGGGRGVRRGLQRLKNGQNPVCQ